MDRLLRRPKKPISLSTGVCDPLVVVDIDENNPSTFQSVAITDENVWEEIEYDISIVTQMSAESIVKGKSPQEQAELKLPEMDTSNQSILSTATSNVEPLDLAHAEASILELEMHSPETENPDFVEVISQTIKKCGSYQKFRSLLNRGISLYLRDAGGQVEFQEIIALLIFGPSIFLFVFRADLQFQSRFSIEYRASESESTNYYTSSVTTEETLLQCLAGVHAMVDAPVKTDIKTHKPLVFIIGTHKDRLGPSASERISELNKHLDSLLRNTGFQDLVQYADNGKGEVMFAVDNTSESDEDFKQIRSSIQSLIRGRDEFSIQYPISYLFFCLELQSIKRSVLSLDECKAMAAEYGIVGEQVSHLLQFLHLRIGIIQYYDVDGLRHIVLNEPQVLYNEITNLIIRTFSCKSLRTKEQKDFQKGILTPSVLKNVFNSNQQLTCREFLKLLVHLRIITPFHSADKEERYFIPCVLNHVEESSEEDLSTDILPLSVQFLCSHCPKGLFSVLVTHLMTPEPDQKSNGITSFTLLQDKIFKDQVSFDVHSCSDVDEMSLKLFPSRIEIKLFPSLCADRDLPIGEVCNNVRQFIETSILKSLEDLHYSKYKVEPVACFRCEHCPELHQVKKGKSHHRMYCKQTRTITQIPLKGRCWYNEGESYPACWEHFTIIILYLFSSSGHNSPPTPELIYGSNLEVS